MASRISIPKHPPQKPSILPPPPLPSSHPLPSSPPATPSSSSSPSSPSPCSDSPITEYEVFISFRGADTRNTFTGYLYDALTEKGIPTFLDDEELTVGEPIHPNLMKAINDSRMAVLVLSERYGDSWSCLEELSEIVKLMDDKVLRIFPIFYHVDPSDVRNQRGKFGEAFRTNEGNPKKESRMRIWSAALAKVANLKGAHLQNQSELKFINDVVNRISSELNDTLAESFNGLFGMESRVKELKSYLDLEREDVMFIGICGMNGTGKTTLARVTFDHIRDQFRASSFLDLETEGIVSSQERLIVDMKLQNGRNKMEVLGKRLRNRKVLIVIDGVEEAKQLEGLAGSHGWFGNGSRIIITTTNKQLLVAHGVDNICIAKKLNDEEAMQLFLSKAFKRSSPEDDHISLAKDFVTYAKGLPLALEVLARSLCDKKRDIWKSTWDKLKQVPDGDIMETLKTGFEKLDDRKKKLFLDIACLFVGEDQDRVINILDSCGYYSVGEMDVLKDKSLITSIGKKLWMHRLLQEMGRRIDSSESLEVRSRLCYWDNIHSRVVEEERGVDGLLHYLPEKKEVCLNVDALSRMRQLKLLKIKSVHVPKDLSCVSDELCLLEWHGYHFKSMPRNFQPRKLVELVMHRSSLEQLWKGKMMLDKLRVIDLTDSEDLIKVPDLTGVTNLEKLILQGCTKLSELNQCVSGLKRLVQLNLKGCIRLRILPHEMNLESLKILVLSHCSSIELFPEVGPDMTSLSEIYLDGTAIDNLPPSFEYLTGLTVLDLENCKNLLCFPEVVCRLPLLKTLTLSGWKGQPPTSFDFLFSMSKPISLTLPSSFSGLNCLESLDLSDCNLLDGTMPDDLSSLVSLQSLNLSSNNFACLPDSISQLLKLKLLYLNNCSLLQSLPFLPLSLKLVMARGCTSLQDYVNRVVVWTSGETGFTIIDCLIDEETATPVTEFSLSDMHFQPLWQKYMEEQIHDSKVLYTVSAQTETPGWFTHHSTGCCVPLPLPPYDDSSWKGIAFFAVVEVSKHLDAQDSEKFYEFHCRLDVDGGPADRFLVLNIPKDKLYTGSCGIWLYISHEIVKGHLDERSCISPSLSTRAAAMEIKECAARVLHGLEVTQFVENLSHKVFGDPNDLRQCHEQFIQYHMNPPHNYADDDDATSCKSRCQDMPIPRLERELTALLLRLYQEDCARFHCYDYLFPQSGTPRWFHHQNFWSYIRMTLPPDLINDETWMGFAVYALYAVNPTPSVASDDSLSSAISVNFSSLSGAHEDPSSPYIAFPLSRDVFKESHRLLIFYIPGILFLDKLHRHNYIWASFRSHHPDVEVQMCGINMVYEHNVSGFVQSLVQHMLASPPTYHKHYYSNLLQTVEKTRTCDCSKSYRSMPRRMPKLLQSTSMHTEASTSGNPSLPLGHELPNLSAGCSSEDLSSSSPISLGIPFGNGDCTSAVSVSGLEAWFKTYLLDHFEKRSVFNHSFPQREIPGWFSYQSNNEASIAIELPTGLFDDPDWLGFALCSTFSFHKHPTAVRNGLGLGDSHRLICQLTSNLGPLTPLFFHSISDEDVVISLHRRALTWISFIPRNIFLHKYGAMFTWIRFLFLSESQDLSALDCGINLVYQQDMEDFSKAIVQCVTSYVDFLYKVRKSCREESVFERLPIYHPEKDDDIGGIADSYEALQYSMSTNGVETDEGSGSNVCPTYEGRVPQDQSCRRRFLEFHPSTLYNCCFPPNKIHEWFTNQSDGYFVSMNIPQNLFDDNSWLGLSLFAVFTYCGNPHFVLEQWFSKVPHYLYCNFESNIKDVDQILACRTGKAEILWLHNLGKFIWISYVPGQPFSHMLNHCNRIDASFVSEWPGVMVQKCGLRLLYSQDSELFKQKINHCNSLINDYEESNNQFMDVYDKRTQGGCQDKSGIRSTSRSNENSEMKTLTPMDEWMPEPSDLDPLGIDLSSPYSFCFPPREVLKWFTDLGYGPSVTIQTPSHSSTYRNDWKGLAVCIYFSIDEQHEIGSKVDPNNPEISHSLICYFESNAGDLGLPPHFRQTTREEALLLRIQGSFIWLTYTPRNSFPDWAQNSCLVEVTIASDWPGLVVRKCGACLFYENDNEKFERIVYSCITASPNREFMRQNCNEEAGASGTADSSISTDSGVESAGVVPEIRDKGKRVVEE